MALGCLAGATQARDRLSATASFDVRRPIELAASAGVLEISGRITAGAADRFRELLDYDMRNGLRVTEIWFNSSGGDNDEAERIGGAIRTWAALEPAGLVTRVAEGDVCDGACVLAFLGGSVRRVDPGGQLAVAPLTDEGLAGQVVARANLNLYARAPYLTPEQIEQWRQAVADGDIDPFSGMIYADLDLVREDTVTSEADRQDNARKRARLRDYNALIDALERGREREVPAYLRGAEKAYAGEAAHLGAYVGAMTGNMDLVTDVMLQPESGAPEARARTYRDAVRRRLTGSDLSPDEVSALVSVPEDRDASGEAPAPPLILLDAGALERYAVVTPAAAAPPAVMASVTPAPSPAVSLRYSGSAPSYRP
jgi:hypothetical protein